jgi:hypothetical protein
VEGERGGVPSEGRVRENLGEKQRSILRRGEREMTFREMERIKRGPGMNRYE